ncbi:hypothetical protein [uncultured Thiohalocapsa sp.]|jgi:hypothetical protein|uniref:hypothetical protein n=1 Tax=uncultured Thiohalocapsa sp. TaxID=768990 RepID=UPI0025D89F79|nr:hypothetical protein [uncultured Thiohalocapsa sp.]
MSSHAGLFVETSKHNLGARITLIARIKWETAIANAGGIDADLLGEIPGDDTLSLVG